MTLILGGASRDGFAHVSDRWLTRSDLRSPQDTESNKSIVVVFNDFMMAFGYTGIAYLGGKPTDHVIAELIADVAFDDRFAQGGFEVTSWKMLSLWQTVERLRVGVAAQLHRVPARDARNFAMDMVGMHWTRGYTVPFAWTLTWRAGEMRLHRADLGGGPDRFAVTAEGSGRPYAGEVWRELRVARGPVSDLENLSQRLVELLQVVSNRDGKTVGPDAMRVTGTIEGGRPQVSVDFVLSSNPSQALDDPSKANVLTGRTPWILTPGSVLAPSMVLGHQQMTLTTDYGFEVEIKIGAGTPPRQREGGRLLFAMSSQARSGPLGEPPALDARYEYKPPWMTQREDC